MASESATTEGLDIDQRVILHGVSWDQYESVLAIRGESPGVRLSYLEGELELMSPSRSHEILKKLIARLLEAFAEERQLPLNGYGSWTVKRRVPGLGLEPDECYVLGTHDVVRPDLAIEVVWTSGGLPAGRSASGAWNRMGTKLLPRLRSGEDLEIGIDIVVIVEGAAFGITTRGGSWTRCN